MFAVGGVCVWIKAGKWGTNQTVDSECPVGLLSSLPPHCSVQFCILLHTCPEKGNQTYQGHETTSLNEERLERLGLLSWEKRCASDDMIEVYNIMDVMHEVGRETFSSLFQNTRTHAHPMWIGCTHNSCTFISLIGLTGFCRSSKLLYFNRHNLFHQIHVARVFFTGLMAKSTWIFACISVQISPLKNPALQCAFLLLLLEKSTATSRILQILLDSSVSLFIAK